MSKIDISIFDELKDCQPTVFINSGENEVFFLKVLYDNCLRMGGLNNLNVTMASVHPSIWFSDFYVKCGDCIKMVCKNANFEIIQVVDDKIQVKTHSTESIQFYSDAELYNFFENFRGYKSLALFSITKLLELKNFKTTWVVRYKDLTSVQEMRNAKIADII
jgi:hypothetical protein